MSHSIATLLKQAQQKISSISDSSHLDAEVLLAHSLQKPRSYLFAHPEQQLSASQAVQYSQLIQQRQLGTPIAYITGKQEFWSLELMVNEHVLIPRAETELLVEIILEKLPEKEQISLADIGTGSGAIALAIASERPHWQIYGTDTSTAAIQLAKTNARNLQIENITFLLGDWCQPLPSIKFDAMVSNPPYIAESDPDLAQYVKKFEPKQALIAGESGLEAFQAIIAQAKKYLHGNGLLIFEHGHLQAQSINKLLTSKGFLHIHCVQDHAGLDRITYARYTV